MTVYATSGTESGIRKLIAEFYCGCPKELRKISETEFDVLHKGTEVIGKVFVRGKGRRTVYSFTGADMDVHVEKRVQGSAL